MKLPKTQGKNKKNQTFFKKPGFRQSWTKVSWVNTAIFIFCCISPFPLKTAHPFRNFYCISPSPPPYTKLKIGKNSGYTRPTLFVGCGILVVKKKLWAILLPRILQTRRSVHSNTTSSHCTFGAWQNSEVAGRTGDLGNWIRIGFFESFC